jgi:dTDP-4-amino-4,6-dideoxygalactose transaminase
MTKRPVHVTRSSLAPLEELLPYLESIWDSGMMTNDGPLVQRFEQELANYLDVPDVICVSSGTSALQLTLRALDIRGEVITTPFTFIATANVIAWENCTPVFVDICPDTWNIDVDKIEQKITPKTTAILAVHVFSSPCDTEQLASIAEQHNLKLIYDAAHAIAVKKNGHSLLKQGEISTLSFHATKILNTAEGGACVTEDPELANRLRRLRFFGFNENKEVVDIGINAKMSEISAALGLVNLKHLDNMLAIRRKKYELYQQCLGDLSFVQFQSFLPGEYNYAYMPVLLENQDQVERIIGDLENEEIYPRRYFYPSLDTLHFPGSQTSMPVTERVSRNILCLPLYDTLPEDDIELICRLIRNS